MLKRHEDALSQRIETVAWKGFSFLNWWELNVWYNQDRISKSIWRDLRDRFREGAKEESAELFLYETNDGVMLIHSDGLKRLNPDGSRQNISAKSGLPAEMADVE